MWEALELCLPWRELTSNGFVAPVLDAVEAGRRPPISSHSERTAPAGFIDLMRACWSQDPQSRPPFNIVMKRLEDMRVSIRKRNWRSESMPLAFSDSTSQSAPSSYRGRDGAHSSASDIEVGVALTEGAISTKNSGFRTRGSKPPPVPPKPGRNYHSLGAK